MKCGKYVITLDGIISRSAIARIDELLCSEYGYYFGEDEEDVIGTQWVAKRGTFPKRLFKYIKSRYGVKMDGDFLSVIGKIARESCNGNPQEFIFYISPDICWKPGDYGDGGSCFWGENREAQDMLENAGFRALRLHSLNDEPLARCWAVPYKEYWVVFNCYANKGLSFSLVTFARIISDLFQAEYYRNIDLSNQEEENGMLYINGGKGYIVGPLSCQKIDDVNLDISRVYIYCSNCDEGVRPNEIYTGPDGDEFCEYCFHDLVRSCANCDQDTYEDDLYCVTVEGRGEEMWCERCTTSHAQSCDRCEITVPREEMTYLANGDAICPECAYHTSECPICHKIHDGDDMGNVWMGNVEMRVCEDCIKDEVVECDCGDLIWIKTAIFIKDNAHPQGALICSDCWEKQKDEMAA